MAAEATAGATEAASTSALADNIARKGTNAYYYAHASNLPGSKRMGRTFGGPPPKIEGHEQPAEEERVKRVRIEKYGWSDSNKNVKVYIDWPGADALAEGAIAATLEADKAALLTVTVEPQEGATGAAALPAVHKLLLEPLYDPITAVKVRANSKRITLTLVKKDAFGWPQLKATKK